MLFLHGTQYIVLLPETKTINRNLIIVVATSDGRKALSFVPQTGHSQVSDFLLSNGSVYTGLLDAEGRLDDNQGALIDRRGNRFVGPFVHGLKNGEFCVFIRNRSVAKRIEYKDDIEVNILDD